LFHTQGDDGVDDAVVVLFPVFYAFLFMEKFFEDERKIMRQRLSHLGTGVLRGLQPAQPDQSKERDPEPFCLIFLGLQKQGQLLLRIKDERGEHGPFFFRKLVGKHLVDFAPDRS